MYCTPLSDTFLKVVFKLFKLSRLGEKALNFKGFNPFVKCDKGVDNLNAL